MSANLIYWGEEHATTGRHYHMIDPANFLSQADIYKKIRAACKDACKGRGCFVRDSNRTTSFSVVKRKPREILLRVSCPLGRDAKTKKWRNKIHIFSEDEEFFSAVVEKVGARKTGNAEGYMFDYM